MKTRIVTALVLVDFIALNVWAAVQGGLDGLVALLSLENPWVVVLAADLVIALTLCAAWMWRDARRSGRSPVAWVALTALTGSVGPLAYLLRRAAGGRIATAAALALAMAIVPLGAAPVGAVERQPDAVVDAFLAAWRAQDLDTLAGLYADDVRFADVTQAQEIRGVEALKQTWGGLMAAHVAADVVERSRVEEGGRVVVEVSWRGTLAAAATGRDTDCEYDVDAVLIFDIAEGLIRAQTDYTDVDRLRAQLAN